MSEGAHDEVGLQMEADVSRGVPYGSVSPSAVPLQHLSEMHHWIVRQSASLKKGGIGRDEENS